MNLYIIRDIILINATVIIKASSKKEAHQFFKKFYAPGRTHFEKRLMFFFDNAVEFNSNVLILSESDTTPTGIVSVIYHEIESYDPNEDI